MQRIVLHPYVFFPLLLALISFVFAWVVRLPVLSVVGSTRTGEGIAWWFDWAMLTFSATLIFRFRFWRRVFSVMALMSFFIVFVLCLNSKYEGSRWAPYYFTDFNAFTILALIPILAIIFYKYTSRRIFWAVLYGSMITLFYVSENHIALLYSVVGVAFFLVLWLFVPVSERVKTGVSLLALAVIPFVVLLEILIVLNLPNASGYYSYEIGALSTVFSRAYLAGMAFKPLEAQPLAWLTGLGWGSYVEHVTKFLPTEWINLTLRASEQWDGLMTDHFHSHNFYVEMLYSAGILATLVLFLFFLTIPVFAKPSQKLTNFIFTGGLISIACFWFMFPLNVPYIALALGALAQPQKPLLGLLRSPRILKNLTLGGLILAMLVQGAAAFVTLKTAWNVTRYDPLPLTAQQAENNCPLRYTDYGLGGLHLSVLLTYRLRRMTEEGRNILTASNPQEKAVEIRENLMKINHLFCQSDIYIRDHDAVSYRLRIARLLARSEALLSLDNIMDQETRAYYAKGWKAELLAWLDAAPERSDVAVPYLLWHFLQGQEQEVLAMAALLLQRNPQDPAGLWFKGVVLTDDAQTTQEGLSMMRRALRSGIERFLPIDRNLKEKLLRGA